MLTIKKDGMLVECKVWLDKMNYLDETEQQMINACKLRMAWPHMALMPDTHQGYGLPIGGVIPLRDVIVPNFVGYDIGCGMNAVKTNLTFKPDREDIEAIMILARNRIPHGLGQGHDHPRSWSGIVAAPDSEPIMKNMAKAQHQLGSLGAGNHFIEIIGRAHV